VEEMGLHPRQLHRQIRRKHIFTHVQWDLQGIYIEVAAPEGELRWMTAEEIETTAALPTAYRQFWEEIQDV